MLFLFLHIKFSCPDNIAARNSNTKCYKNLNLSKRSRGLITGVVSIFMRRGCKSDIMDFVQPSTVITEIAVYQLAV